MYVRSVCADQEVHNEWAAVWDDLQQQGLVRCDRLHGAPVFAMAMQPVLRWMQGRLAADPFYCTQRATTDQRVESHEQA